MTPSFLPYGRQLIEADDITSVVEALKSDFLTTGPQVGAFESVLAELVKAPHAVSCSSATAGLHIAAMAAGLQAGEAAIVPAMTFLATANAVRYTGAEVVFSDVNPETGLMRPEDLQAAINRSKLPVKAIFPVHLAGQCEDMTAIKAIAKSIGAIVIEDACHALGADLISDDQKSPIGSCSSSDMAVFSFHPVKTIAMGEGGAITTQNPLYAERLARFRNHGMNRGPLGLENAAEAIGADGTANPWYYEMSELGYNYRASDVNCALGLSQLRKLERFVEIRRRLVDYYAARLAPLAPHIRPIRRTSCSNPAWHLSVALIDFEALGVDRGALMRDLRERGIGTQVHYIPVSMQPYYRNRYGKIDLPGAMSYYRSCLSIPLSASMNEADVDRVVDALRECLSLP